MGQAIARVLGLVLLAGFGVAGLAQSGEASQGKPPPSDSAWVAQKTKTCAGCHGKKGVSQSPSFPVLAGQYQNYLLHALTGYRDGGRKNAIMSGQVKGLSDAQLKALARYYSRQQSPLHTPWVD